MAPPASHPLNEEQGAWTQIAGQLLQVVWQSGGTPGISGLCRFDCFPCTAVAAS